MKESSISTSYRTLIYTRERREEKLEEFSYNMHSLLKQMNNLHICKMSNDNRKRKVTHQYTKLVRGYTDRSWTNMLKDHIFRYLEPSSQRDTEWIIDKKTTDSVKGKER